MKAIKKERMVNQLILEMCMSRGGSDQQRKDEPKLGLGCCRADVGATG